MKKPNTESKAKSNSKQEELKIDSFSVNRVHQFDNGGVTFDMTVNGISIYGCRVLETKDGDCIGLPQRKGNDGKYYSIVWARFSDADSKDILAEVENSLIPNFHIEPRRDRSAKSVPILLRKENTWHN